MAKRVTREIVRDGHKSRKLDFELSKTSAPAFWLKGEYKD